MKLPLAGLAPITREELLFSCKCFAAAMLAMFIALWFGLPRPFWAMMTTYVVAHPLAGAVRSKAAYRFGGTLVGSAAAILLVGNLSNARELLMLALSLWMAGCLYLALRDRTPRSYVFMLAGYTAALIGFPSVDTPLQVFDTAIARVEEIGLGILCGSLVHTLVFPRSIAPVLLEMLDRTLRDTAQWLHDVLQPRREATTVDADRRRVAADITQLRMLSTHVPYDTSHLRWTAGALSAMQDGAAALAPVLSAVEDRLQALRDAQQGVLDEDIAALVESVDRWVREPTQDDADTLLAAIRALPGEGGDDWQRALRIGLAQRLEELVVGWRQCAELRAAIDRGLRGEPAAAQVRALGNHVLHYDRGMAVLSAFSTVLAVLACCAFWILTGWPSGAAMPMMAAVFCMLFSTLDDPVPAINGFLKGTLWSVPLAALYVLVAMPLMHDFGMVVLLCAPAFVLLGCFVPRTTPGNQAMPIIFGVAGALAMHDTANADLVSFANSMVGQVLGTVAAAQVTALVRSVSADWSARRIQRATWQELGELAAGPRRRAAGDAYAVRMLDRIGLLAPRIAQAKGPVAPGAAQDALHDLRTGADIVALQRARAGLPPSSADAVLAAVAALFRARATSSDARVLLPQLDGALHAALDSSDESAERRRAISALVGLRRNLCPDAPAVLAGAPLQGEPA
ncbi:FUSC family protein [Ramlibacter sp. G-1-2-2]|uniref:FUSC family protein n=1 Tax=Ramlibacter agri TaxID=2728837 RepID=A0A848HBU4_9BURK|nr:FUSC family protein [Ramlibacter agri]NML45048.1 FUSC family protein [Ramlibacter agri]